MPIQVQIQMIMRYKLLEPSWQLRMTKEIWAAKDKCNLQVPCIVCKPATDLPMCVSLQQTCCSALLQIDANTVVQHVLNVDSSLCMAYLLASSR